MASELKTTTEERARFRIASLPDNNDRERVTRILDDIDTLAAEVRGYRKILEYIVSVAKREGVAFHANNLARAVAEAEYMLAPEPKHDLRFCKCHCVHGVDVDGPACATCENST